MKDRRKAKTAVIVGTVLALLAVVNIIVTVCLTNRKAIPLTTYWSSESTVTQNLRDYVSKVTDPKDTAGYIPEKDRIAVFDMD